MCYSSIDNIGMEHNEKVDISQERRSNIVRIKNYDASLNIPFLDKINKYWYVGGNTQIRNANFIRLTGSGSQNSHGIVMSNGLGDNTIDDFEITLRFKISSNNNNKRETSEGLALMIASENKFLKDDLYSSFAKKQYEMNSGGILPGDDNLMGFPKNLPGLALVIDTNDNISNKKVRAPFFSAFVNNNPKEYFYDRESDGENSNVIKLTDKHIKLKKSILEGEVVELRLIYLESISFLKVDVRYTSNENYWIELLQSNAPLYLPKNLETNQRYIGIGALAKENAANIDILNIATNEFHWRGRDEVDEHEFDFAKEIQLFLKEEFGKRTAIEKDNYTKWQLMKAQPSFEFKENVQHEDMPNSNNRIGRFFSFILKSFLYLFLTCMLYLLSVYIRVSIKHVNNFGNKRRQSGLLPVYA